MTFCGPDFKDNPSPTPDHPLLRLTGCLHSFPGSLTRAADGDSITPSYRYGGCLDWGTMPECPKLS